jgi:hypothetical protein
MVLQIPAEVTGHALTFFHPLDVAKFSQTCHLAYTLVYDNQALWRELYLKYPFDDPRKALDPRHAIVSYDWKGELQRRMQAELIAYNIEQRFEERNLALETFVSVISNATPAQSPLEYQNSGSLQWVTGILRDSRILDALVVEPDGRNNQLISRIQTYCAFSLDMPDDDSTKARLAALRLRSRCQVYNMRNYRRDNNYGPYLGGGQINWIHAESLVNVIRMNLAELHGVSMDTRPPVGLQATRAYSAPGAANRTPEDWACIEGTWRRYVCFLDYR